MTGPFTAEQLHTLTASIDRIVPKDEFPSASEAGCLEFLLRLIPLENQVEQYRTGLDKLDLAAHNRGKCFAEMSAEEQDDLLKEVAPDFVDTLARQTIEGYYADPDNGGNKGGIAWTMVGFEVRN